MGDIEVRGAGLRAAGGRLRAAVGAAAAAEQVEARRDAVADLAAFGTDPTHVNDVVGPSAHESEGDWLTWTPDFLE